MASRRRYYLLANRPFPPASATRASPSTRTASAWCAPRSGLRGNLDAALGVRHGFFASVDGAPAEGYRAERAPGAAYGHAPRGDAAPITVVTGAYGARVLSPLVDAHPRTDVRILEVANDFFGGNIGVAGLLTGADLARALAAEPEGERYLLPDVCLSQGRFLDGTTLADLPRTVEVIPRTGRRCAPCSTGGPFPAQHPTRPPRMGRPRRAASPAGRPPLVESS